MAKTSLDVITRALRELEIIANDTVPSASDYSYAKDTLDACIAELSSQQGATITWDAETVPDAVFIPMALWVAADIAGHYMVAPNVPRSRAIGRVRAYAMPDDRPLHGDADNDGTVTEAELAAAQRAAYY